MTTVNIGEAKTHFEELLERIVAGEEVIIARRGNPIVRMVPVRKESDRLPVRDGELADDLD